MKKYLTLVLGATLLLSGCDYAKLQSSYKDDATFENGQMQPQPSFAQFKEIPIPEKATMDLKKTMLFGNDPLVGRLAFSAPYNQSNLFDFYVQEMPKFGWSEITMIRSSESFLTYSKEGRIATIRLVTTVSGSCDVVFDISFGKPGKGY